MQWGDWGGNEGPRAYVRVGVGATDEPHVPGVMAVDSNVAMQKCLSQASRRLTLPPLPPAANGRRASTATASHGWTSVTPPSVCQPPRRCHGSGHGGSGTGSHTRPRHYSAADRVRRDGASSRVSDAAPHRRHADQHEVPHERRAPSPPLLHPGREQHFREVARQDAPPPDHCREPGPAPLPLDTIRTDSRPAGLVSPHTSPAAWTIAAVSAALPGRHPRRRRTRPRRWRVAPLPRQPASRSASALCNPSSGPPAARHWPASGHPASTTATAAIAATAATATTAATTTSAATSTPVAADCTSALRRALRSRVGEPLDLPGTGRAWRTPSQRTSPLPPQQSAPPRRLPPPRQIPPCASPPPPKCAYRRVPLAARPPPSQPLPPSPPLPPAFPPRTPSPGTTPPRALFPLPRCAHCSGLPPARRPVSEPLLRCRRAATPPLRRAAQPTPCLALSFAGPGAASAAAGATQRVLQAA